MVFSSSTGKSLVPCVKLAATICILSIPSVLMPARASEARAMSSRVWPRNGLADMLDSTAASLVTPARTMRALVAAALTLSVSSSSVWMCGWLPAGLAGAAPLPISASSEAWMASSVRLGSASTLVCSAATPGRSAKGLNRANTWSLSALVRANGAAWGVAGWAAAGAIAGMDASVVGAAAAAGGETGAAWVACGAGCGMACGAGARWVADG